MDLACADVRAIEIVRGEEASLAAVIAQPLIAFNSRFADRPGFAPSSWRSRRRRAAPSSVVSAPKRRLKGDTKVFVPVPRFT
ncbi:MAG: hypothetical protein ACREFZ_03610 [Acetobacteraceae bacterium]